jgi:SAM-dependent methyltransferase
VRKELHQANRLSWNAATRAHNSHKGDQAKHLREGESTLFPEELELLGELRGKNLVHLQCNSGQDTLSLARLGASAIGVDISDEAIDFATKLSADAGIAARFERADIFDWMEATEERFEIAFSSYGTYGWLSDLDAWARGIARVLTPNGRFVLVDFHPVAFMFDQKWQLRFPYSGGTSWESSGVSDYVGISGTSLAPWGDGSGVANFDNPHPSHEFAWGVGDLIGAFLKAGFTLETFREYDYCNGARLFDEMRELPRRRFVPPEGLPALPLMLGLVARR